MHVKVKSLLGITAGVALGVAGCLQPPGDPLSDRNKDGIYDSVSGVREVDEVIEVAPSSPTFVVTGRLTNGYTNEPVANTVFRITTAKGVQFSESTDDNGDFQVNGVAPGSFVLEATAEGFAPVRAVIGLGAANGNTSNFNRYLGNVRLFPTDGTWSFTAMTSDGRPVANAVVYIDVPSALIDMRTAALSRLCPTICTRSSASNRASRDTVRRFGYPLGINCS
jgi:hypothetical protein